MLFKKNTLYISDDGQKEKPDLIGKIIIVICYLLILLLLFLGVKMFIL